MYIHASSETERASQPMDLHVHVFPCVFVSSHILIHRRYLLQAGKSAHFLCNLPSFLASSTLGKRLVLNSAMIGQTQCNECKNRNLACPRIAFHECNMFAKWRKDTMQGLGSYYELDLTLITLIFTPLKKFFWHNPAPECQCEKTKCTATLQQYIH